MLEIYFSDEIDLMNIKKIESKLLCNNNSEGKGYIIKIENKDLVEKKIEYYLDENSILERILSCIKVCKSVVIMCSVLKEDIIEEFLLREIEVNILLDRRVNNSIFSNLYKKGVNVRLVDEDLFNYNIILIDDNITLNYIENEMIEIESEYINSRLKDYYKELIKNDKIYDYKEYELEIYCREKKILKSEICIVGSLILEKLGIRKSNDIDFIIISNKRKELKIGRKNKKAGEFIEIVSENWHPLLKDDEIINSKEIKILNNGFKICNLELLKEKKLKHNREKDRRDIKLIDSYLTS